MTKLYDEILREHQGQKILIVGHAYTLRTLWEMLYDNNNEDYTYNEVEREVGLKPLEVIKLPTYQIANELDKWILAELNQTIKNVDTYLSGCEIDAAIKSGIDFVEKLTNWFLRRSRRRFRGSEMTTDKYSAYSTLFEVLRSYLKIMAPFTPFITEEIWQKLNGFIEGKDTNIKSDSLHLKMWPFANDKYIDAQLMEEIATVRKAIKLALFIRSKNKIAVKQPLQSLQLKI
jgi:isoleucyl-tRNA synthetase